jgi:uncharacterized membrane protein
VLAGSPEQGEDDAMKLAPRRSLSSVRQRGAIAVITAVIMISIAVPLMALLVNAGQLYYAQRDLQKLATLAAFDAVRAESGCFGASSGVGGTLAAATAAVTNTLAVNNAGSYGITPTVVFGRYDNTTVAGRRVFKQLTATDPGVDSVQVTLVRPQPATLIPWFTSSGTLTATAAAEHAPVAAFRIGTTVLSLSETSGLNSLLGGLLGSNVNLSLISYQGLASANVTLEGLKTSLGIGDTHTLLTTQLPLGTLVQGLANAAAAGGQATVAGTLNGLAALADPSKKTSLGQALGVENLAENLVGSLPLNTLEILNSLAMSANNGLYPIALPISLNVLNVVTLNAYLQVGSVPAQPSMSDLGTAAGRPGFNPTTGLPHTQAQQQQVTIELRLVVFNLPLIGALAQVKIGADIAVAQATSYLSSIKCPTLAGPSQLSQPVMTLMTTLNPATVTLGSFSSLNPAQPVTSGSLLNVLFGLVSVNLSKTISATVAGTGPVATSFSPPFPASQTVGSVVSVHDTVNGLSATLQNNLTICVTPLLCLNAGGLASFVTSLLTPLLSVVDAIVDPLLNVLGVQLGAATLSVDLNAIDYGNKAGRPVTDAGTVPALYNQQKAGETAGTR